MTKKTARGTCPHCQFVRELRVDGTLGGHKINVPIDPGGDWFSQTEDISCPGVGQKPLPTLSLTQHLMLDSTRSLLFLELDKGVLPPNRRALASLVAKGYMLERVPGHFAPTEAGRRWRDAHPFEGGGRRRSK
jgi:hypothetical protein